MGPLRLIWQVGGPDSVFCIEAEKGHQNRLLPWVPDFAEFLQPTLGKRLYFRST